jgi:hypothetical protein
LNAKQLLVIALGGTAVLSGIVGQYFYPGIEAPPTTLWFALGGAFLLFAWYRIDADMVGYRRSLWLNIGVVGLAIIVLPYYFLRSRGAKRGFVATGLFLLGAIAWSFLGSAGQYAVYFWLQS